MEPICLICTTTTGLMKEIKSTTLPNNKYKYWVHKACVPYLDSLNLINVLIFYLRTYIKALTHIA
jgi:hypothetical protein